MKERKLKLFVNHGFKLTIANLFGSILNTILSAIGLFVFGCLLLFLLLGKFIFTLIEIIVNYLNSEEHILSLLINITNAFTSFSFSDSPLLLFMSIVVLCCYAIYQLWIQSMMIGGLYGSVVHAVFEGKNSVRAYFSYSFRNLGKLMKLQFLLILLSIPFFILVVIFNIGLESLFDSPNIIYFQISFSIIFFLIFCTSFLHSPIIIIKEKVDAFRAVMLSFRLIKNELYTVLYSGTLFFTTLAFINGIFLIILLFLLHLSGVSLVDFQFEQLNLASYVIVILGMFIWFPFILPYSMICSMLILVKQYKQHFHHILSPTSYNPVN